MGVTIFVKNGKAEISMPCSSLQEFRFQLLEAVFRYIEKKYEEEDLELNELYYSSLLKSKARELFKLTKINYEEFGKTMSIFYELGLIGIFKFIDHGDDSGYHSPGDAKDMLDSFKKINEFVSEKCGVKFEYFISIFIESISSNSLIVYQ